MAEDPRQCGYTAIEPVDYPSVAESDVKNKMGRTEDKEIPTDQYPCDPNFAANAGGKIVTPADDKDNDD